MDNIIIWDIETPRKCFLASFYDPSCNEWKDFIIKEGRNDLSYMLRYMEDNIDKWFVGFNNLKFDGQVLQFIYQNSQKWFNLSGGDIAKLISDFGSMEIENLNYGLFPTYREQDFHFKQLDLGAIWHFFGEQKKTSLKQLEYEMRAENIENLEFDMDQEFEGEELDKLIHYCHNDVFYTYQHYLFTIGQTDHKLYKGKNRIQDRLIMMQEFGIPCMNYDDVKIGAEWNKKDYIKATGRKEDDLKPKKVNHFYGKKYKRFFPNTVEFQTEGVKKYVKEIGESIVKAEKEEFIYSFSKDLQVCIGKGGIHSREKFRFIKPDEDEIYLQCDIGSQYPNAIRKYGVEPKHLPGWCNMIVRKIARRLAFKKQYKETKDPKFNSLQEMGKLSLNGGSL